MTEKLAPHPYVDMVSTSENDDDDEIDQQTKHHHSMSSTSNSSSYSNQLMTRRSESNTNSLSLLFVTNSSRPNVRMYIVVLVSLLNAIVYGLNNGNFGNVQIFKSFLETWCEGNPTYDDSCEPTGTSDLQWQSRFVTWCAAYVILGNTVGTLFLGPSVSNSIGRRVCAAASASLCILGTVLTISTTSSVAQFMIGRFITGVATGSMCYVAPVILHETAPSSLRRRSGLLFQLFIVVGSAAAVFGTSSPQHTDWRIGLALPAIPCIIILFLLVFVCVFFL
jgi:MFS family permease